ncbi:MAG: phosphate starvation-inducible protein PhoH [Clostridiales bacterium]|nr:phosphate starvation-inducible protein PhoH [Clostridiales bacterium]
MTTEKIVTFDRLEELSHVLGAVDENVSAIERAFGVSIAVRDGGMKVIGEPEAVDLAARVLDGLLQLAAKGEQIDPARVGYVISLTRDGQEDKLRRLGGDVICVTVKGKPIKAKTLGQQTYIDAIKNNTITLSIGPAGTGKTYLAVAMAVAAFRAHRVNRIIVTRPAIEAGEKLGFLPGDLQSKVDPYLRPLYDGLFDMLGAESFQKYMERGSIEVAPLAYMRGRTLEDSFIILDEAQNTTVEQMKMFLTRLGANSKAVITGDVTQIDLPRPSRSGLIDAEQVLRGVEDVGIVRLGGQDVVRHQLVQRIIHAYERHEARQQRREAGGDPPAQQRPAGKRPPAVRKKHPAERSRGAKGGRGSAKA